MVIMGESGGGFGESRERRRRRSRSRERGGRGGSHFGCEMKSRWVYKDKNILMEFGKF